LIHSVIKEKGVKMWEERSRRSGTERKGAKNLQLLFQQLSIFAPLNQVQEEVLELW